MDCLEQLYRLRELYETNREDFHRIYRALTREQQTAVASHWYFKSARLNQILPWHREWDEIIWKPGRGFGKNWGASRNILDYVLNNPGHRVNCFARTASECNDVLIQGESGIEKAANERGLELVQGTQREWPPEGKIIYLVAKDHAQLRFSNKALIRFYGPNKTRGLQSHLTFVDEFFTWYEGETGRNDKLNRAYEELLTTTRLGKNPRLFITSTPQPVEVLKLMYKKRDNGAKILIVTGTTFDNPNLPESYKQRLIEQFGGTRRGLQELYGSETFEIPGALWKLEDIKHTNELPVKLKRTIVAVDPAATKSLTSDECGIVVVGKGEDNLYYILADISDRLSPQEWATRAIKAYEQYECDAIIYESNQGGDMVSTLIHQAKRGVPTKAVRASKGKYARAEPIAALYEQGKVFHVGTHKKLEEQMLGYSPDLCSKSPDRMDALVWGLTELSKVADYNVTWV